MGELVRYFICAALLCIDLAGAAVAAPLELESKIPLGDIRGRIDHLAIDLGRQVLYVAELGNDSVGVVDLKERKTIRTLTGLKEPQGIGYAPSSDTVYVANAGDGSVRLYRGSDLAPTGQIALGDDADNIRVDDANHRIFVGYGSGALAVIDAASLQKAGDILLKGHPESFQLDSSGTHIYVNVPDAREIAVVDRVANKQTGSWRTNDLRANYPLVLDQGRQRVLAVFRHPSKIGVFRAQDGAMVTSAVTCGDADDVFLDSTRDRIYVSCGEGFVDVLAAQGNEYQSVSRIPTSSGARTGLFVPSLDLFLLAVRASGSSPASIWVYRPHN
jgi:DNA-binding beta-propeller fold protein YncE